MMNRKEIFTEENLIIVAAAFFTAAMVAFPAITEAGTKSAISIWLNSVVPVLLPFFIFADFIKHMVDMERMPIKVYPMVMAFLSGYPMGAKIVGDLVNSGILSPDEGRHVLSYSLVTGPAFILGTVGIFLGSSQAAAISALAHYAGALCNGVFWRFDGCKSARVCHISVNKGNRKTGYMSNFTDSIMAGFKAMAVILAWLIFFMIGTDMIEITGFFDLFPGEEWKSFMKGLLEMTMGTNAVGMCNINIGLKTVLSSFLISFGGLCVIGQSVSVSGGGWLKAGELIKIKITHGLFAGILASAMIIFGKTVFPGEFMI